MSKKHKKKSEHYEDKDPLSLFIKKSQLWAEKRFKALLALLCLGFIVFGLSLLYSYWLKRQNLSAEEVLHKLKHSLILAEKSAGGNILSFNNSQNFFSQAKPAPTLNQEVDTLSTNYINAIKKHKAKPAGKIAGIEMAHFLYQYKKPKQAIELLQDLDSCKKKNLIGFLVSFQLGTYLMSAGDYDKALSAFEFIANHDRSQWLKPEVLLKMALIYEKQNQIDKARNTYQQIKKDFPDSHFTRKAKQYLNLLNLQNKIQKKPLSMQKKTGN